MKYLKTFEGLFDFFKKEEYYDLPNDSDKQYWNFDDNKILKYNRYFSDPDLGTLYLIFDTIDDTEKTISEDTWQRLRKENRIKEATPEEIEEFQMKDDAKNIIYDNEI